MKITDKIKLFLKLSGLSQQELAKRAGVHPVTLCNLLNGKTGQKNALFKLDAFIEDELIKKAEETE